MRPIFAALVAVATIPLTACHFGHGDDDTPGIASTGSGSQRSYAAADFSQVTLAGSDNVDIRVGTAYSVRAEGLAEELDRLRIRRKGDMLTVDRRGRHWGRGETVKVYVTLPRLTRVTVAGSGDMAIDRIDGSSFSGTVAGSGTLAIAGAAVDALELTTAGSGDIHAAGTAKRANLQSAGSGDIDAARLTASEAEVSIAGSGDVRATVNGPATINMVGAGDVDLGPGARCTTQKIGAGEVRCGN